MAPTDRAGNRDTSGPRRRRSCSCQALTRARHHARVKAPSAVPPAGLWLAVRIDRPPAAHGRVASHGGSLSGSSTPFERLTWPSRERRARVVRALAKLQQRLPRGRRRSHGVVSEQEHAEFVVPPRGLGPDCRALQARGCRRRVCEERGLAPGAITGPESATAAFVGVAFLGNL